MAYVKPEEVRKMNGDDRLKTLFELRKELQHERGVAAMGGSPPSPGKIRQIRRQIARILTIQNEERLGIRGQTEKKLSAKPKQEAPIPIPEKGQPAQAARKAHEYHMAKQAKQDALDQANAPKPAPKQMKMKSTERAPKKSAAKQPAAPEKAAANKAAKGAGSKPKKEETRRNG
jgi:large subunit ribosomal protein L29